MLPTQFLVSLLLIAATLPVVSDDERILHISGFDDKGIAIKTVSADEATGRLGEMRTIFQRDGTILIGPLAANAAGNRLATVSPDVENPAGRLVYLVDVGGENASVREVSVPAKPEAAVFWGENNVLVHTSQGELHLVDHAAGTILKSVAVRDLVEPRAHLIEAIAIVPDQPTVICVMKEDAPGKGQRLGGRLIGLTLPALEVQFDLRIDAAEVAAWDSTGVYTAQTLNALSFGPESRLRGAGPNGIAFSLSTNTVAVTLDNWGAVILADLDGLLKGRWTNATLLSPEAVPGEWHPAAPVPIVFERTDAFVIGNAGASGGVTLLDAAARRIVKTMPLEAPATLACPVVLPGRSMALFTRAGLTRSRGTERVEESHQEMDELVTLDFRDGLDAVSLTRQKFANKLYHAAQLFPESERHVFLAFLVLEPRGMKVGVYDLDTGTFTDERAVPDVLRGNAFALPGQDR